MSKKALPKAIRRMTDDTPEVIVVPGANGQHETPVPPASPTEPSSDRVAANPAQVSHVVGAAPVQAASSPTPAVLVRPDSMGAAIDATGRRSQALKIVERHAVYAAVGGIIPVPIANVASVTAVIVRMVKVLSDLYGTPFERDRARAIVVGFMGGAMPTGLGAVTTSTLGYIVPGSGLLGLAVSSVTAVACTRSIGRIFVEHFESGAGLHDLPTPVTGRV
ncbi:MAG: YcjF family protein [Xanthobacteraceae bacterium]